jgi:hypothetical protein
LFSFFFLVLDDNVIVDELHGLLRLCLSFSREEPKQRLRGWGLIFVRLRDGTLARGVEAPKILVAAFHEGLGNEEKTVIP